MYVSEERSVELAAYRLKDLAYDRVVSWRKGRGEGAVPTTWQKFQDTFLDKFFPLEMREAKVEEFMNLRQGSMTVREYYLKFNQLAKYVPDLVADNRVNLSKFVTGVSIYVVKECRSAMMNSEMNLSRMMTHTQQIEADKIKERDRMRGNKRARFEQHEQGQTRSQGGSRPQYQDRSSICQHIHLLVLP